MDYDLEQIKARQALRRGERFWETEDEHGCRLCTARTSLYDGIGHDPDCPISTQAQEIDWLIGYVESARAELPR